MLHYPARPMPTQLRRPPLSGVVRKRSPSAEHQPPAWSPAACQLPTGCASPQRNGEGENIRGEFIYYNGWKNHPANRKAGRRRQAMPAETDSQPKDDDKAGAGGSSYRGKQVWVNGQIAEEGGGGAPTSHASAARPPTPQRAVRCTPAPQFGRGREELGGGRGWTNAMRTRGFGGGAVHEGWLLTGQHERYPEPRLYPPHFTVWASAGRGVEQACT